MASYVNTIPTLKCLTIFGGYDETPSCSGSSPSQRNTTSITLVTAMGANAVVEEELERLAIWVYNGYAVLDPSFFKVEYRASEEEIADDRGFGRGCSGSLCT